MSGERLHVVLLAVELDGSASALVEWTLQYDIDCQIKGWEYKNSPVNVPMYTMEVRNVPSKEFTALLLKHPGITVIQFRKHYNSDWVINER